MSKDANLRLQEIIAAVPTLLGEPAIQRTRVEQITSSLTDYVVKLSEQQRNSLDQLLHFGGFHPLASDAERLLRNQRRALLLAESCKGRGGSPARKAQVQQMALPQVKQEFKGLFNDIHQADRPAEVSVGTSFLYATQREYESVNQGAEHMRELLLRCQHRLSSVRSSSTAKAGFVEWFGPYTDAKLGVVLRNINIMVNNPKRLKLLYRGTNLPNLPQRATEAIFSGDEPVMIYPMIGDAGFYAENDRRDNDPIYTYLFIGPDLWDPQVQNRAIRGHCVSRGGVLVHELSHALCHTIDVPRGDGPSGKMYGLQTCRKAAAENDPKVLVNADSYRMYADFGSAA
jgi:hypothetical protein